MKKIAILTLLTIISNITFAQKCPYKVRAKVDVPLTLVLGGTALWGINVLNKKENLDSAEVANLKPEDVNKFDRSATHQRNSSMTIVGDIGMYGAFLAGPTFIFATKRVRGDWPKVGLLYLETMMVMTNFYAWTNGTIDRTRPYLYNPDVSIKDKTVSHSQISFFAGHPAATAASTFFIAKVFHDYYPESKARKYVWAAAAIPPAVVAYARYADGQHFLSDILVGVPLGAAIGIVVPQLHKCKATSEKVQLYPTPGGMGLVYKLD